MKAVSLIIAALSGSAIVYTGTRTPPVALPPIEQAVMAALPPPAAFPGPAVGFLPPGWDMRLGDYPTPYKLIAPAVEDRVPVVITGKTYLQPKDWPVLEISGGVAVAHWTDGRPYVVAYAKSGYYPWVYRNPDRLYGYQFAADPMGSVLRADPVP